MENIKGYILLAGILAIGVFIIGRYDGNLGNLQRTTMHYNEHSKKVAKICMGGEKADKSDYGIVRYEKFYERNQKSDAKAMFNFIISQIGEVHIGKSVKPRFIKRSERYFVCYGENTSIVVSYERFGRSEFGPPFYLVTLEYAETDYYDWEYLTWRINN